MIIMEIKKIFKGPMKKIRYSESCKNNPNKISLFACSYFFVSQNGLFAII